MMKSFIKEYWESNADIYKQMAKASWGDTHAMSLEIDNIKKYISDGDSVLDVGCANGFSTIQIYKAWNSLKMTGVDYSKKMIFYANKNKGDMNAKNINFRGADITHLPFKNSLYDVTYTIRVLINLPTWELQKKGIEECLRVTKKGGTVIFSEGFYEPLVRLNALRMVFHLPPLVEHDFNRYLKQRQLKAYLKSRGIKYRLDDFSSVYYLGSRLLREVVTDAGQFEGYSNPINREFYELEKKYSGGNIGIQQAVIIHKEKA